jgi:PKD repeat protein
LEIKLAGRPEHASRGRHEDVRMDRLAARRVRVRIGAVVAVFLCALAAASAASASSTGTSRRAAYAKISRVCPAPQPGDASCLALARVPVPSTDAGQPGVSAYTAATAAAEPALVAGRTPKNLASAYGYSPAAGGSGQTIALVDAYDDPKIESDLAIFDENYGISACTKANGCFTKVSQSGSATPLPSPDTTGWSVEIALDVEMAHSVCPSCKILLVEAESESFEDLAAGVDEAVKLGATEVSNSYGGPESGLGTAERAAYNHPGVVIAASTGDNGYDDWTAFVNEGEPFAAEQPDAPASLPTVVSVGGTTLELNGSEQRSSETVWNGNGALNESKYIEGATGGGCSTLFGAKPWQEDTPGYGATGCAGKRVAADVSADANPNTGFDIYDSYNCGQVCKRNGEGKGWLMIGGTSLSTPLISSLYALAGGSNGVEYPALTLYGHLGEASSLFDVTEGGNGYCDDGGSACGANARERATVDCEGTTACNAAVGFDGPSGVGAPNSLNLFKPLLPTAAVTPPSSPESGVAASFSGATSTDPYPGAVLSYSWSWGDGSPASSGVAPTHTYGAPGKYTVTLTVSDSYGFKGAPATTEVSVKASTLKEQEEAAAKKKAEEEAAATKKKAEEEAAAAKKKAEEEAAAGKKKAEEEAAAGKKRAEEEANVKAQEEAADEEAQTKAEEQEKGREAARQHEAEENKQHEAELAKQHEAELAKQHEEELAKSSVDAGAQGVNGFQVSFVPPVPDAELAASTLQVSPSGALTLEISCPAAETSCTGTVTLRTLGAVIAGATAPGKKASILTLTSGTFTVAGGKVHAVTLHLSSRARALLKRAHSTRARATLLAHDPLGAVHTTRTIVTLRVRYASRPRS